MYRSKFERDFANVLTELGLTFGYETTVLGYIIPERKGKYTPDFRINTSRKTDENVGHGQGENGRIYIETKGYWDAEDRTKLKLVKEQHPELDLRIVFMNANNKIHKKSKTTYGDWATKHGFKWANKTIPKEWIEELSTHDDS